jgi:hypothetical protein
MVGLAEKWVGPVNWKDGGDVALRVDLKRWGSCWYWCWQWRLWKVKKGWNVRRQERWAGLVCL